MHTPSKTHNTFPIKLKSPQSNPILLSRPPFPLIIPTIIIIIPVELFVSFRVTVQIYKIHWSHCIGQFYCNGGKVENFWHPSSIFFLFEFGNLYFVFGEVEGGGLEAINFWHQSRKPSIVAQIQKFTNTQIQKYRYVWHHSKPLH